MSVCVSGGCHVTEPAVLELLELFHPHVNKQQPAKQT